MEEFSLIIPIYNEGSKPKKLLESIQENLKFIDVENLQELVLVLSGDRNDLEGIKKTVDIPPIILIEEERSGKASAINRALENIHSNNIILISGDVLLGDKTIRRLLKKLNKPKNGVVTGRPLPKVENGSFVEYFVKLIWDLHDIISSEEPKAGEILAFKNVFNSLPEDTAADEEYIKAIVLKRGYKSEYAKKAVVYNEAPYRISGLFEQRRRIYLGHLDLKKRTRYESPSMKKTSVFKALVQYVKENGVGKYFPLALFFELAARFDAFLKYLLFAENPYIWRKVG